MTANPLNPIPGASAWTKPKGAKVTLNPVGSEKYPEDRDAKHIAIRIKILKLTAVILKGGFSEYKQCQLHATFSWLFPVPGLFQERL